MSISSDDLLFQVQTVMGVCIQSTAQSSALAELLIEKGFLTKEELDAKILANQRATKTLADSLDNPAGDS